MNSLRITRVWLSLPVLPQIVALLEVFTTNFARVGNLWGFMGALVDHQIVWFGEAPLTVLTNKFTFWTHLATKVRAAVIVVDSHDGKHCDGELLATSEE